MINKFKKKIILISLICALVATPVAYADEYTTIYDLSDETKISSGITHVETEKLTNGGWMNVNVVRIDLTDEYTYTDPIYNVEGLNKSTTLSTMMNQSGAIAAINGDFFFMGTPVQSYGPIIKDGEIISSPLYSADNYPTISMDNSGAIDISIWNPKITVFNSAGGYLDITYINKGASAEHGAVVLDKYYGEYSIGNSLGNHMIEIVVENNYVKDIRDNEEPVEIPENGYVISYGGAQKENIKKFFTVGEKLKLDIIFDFNLNDLHWAVGGVNHLVKDGEINEYHSGILGYHPRTAVGFNEDNTEMIFVTVDGRNKDYVSITQSELAQLMIELGAYNVVNLDGGGSTTMGVDFLRNGNVEVVNYPSDGRERGIVAGIGVFDNSPESDVLETIKFIPEYDKIFKDTEIKLDVVGYNKYYTQVDISDEKIKYTIDRRSGEIKDDIFIPSKSGEIVIQAEINDVETETTITVLDEPVSISLSNEATVMEEGQQFEIGEIIGVDEDGQSAFIPANSASYRIRNGVGKVEDGVFTAADVNNTGAITVMFGDAMAHIEVKVGYKAKTILGFEEEDFSDLEFSVYPENSAGGIEITDIRSYEGDTSLKLEYDFTTMTDQSIAFVNFDNDEGGLALESKPLGVGMWVYGDNSTHWLRARVEDANGKVHKIDFAEEIDWSGWKWVTASLPVDIAYPVKLKNVYIAEINETKKDTGEIYIDRLRVLYEPEDKDLKLPQTAEFEDELQLQESIAYQYSLKIDEGNYTTDKAEEMSAKEPKIVNLTLTNGSIEYSNLTLWEQLLSLNSYEDENILIFTNYDLNKIVDEREAEVVEEILAEASRDNNIFVISKNEKTQTRLLDGVRHIQYTNSFEFIISEDCETFYIAE